MATSDSFLRQLSSKEAWKSTSRRWSINKNNAYGQHYGVFCNNNSELMMTMKKRVMVVIDHTAHSKHAMMWALTHVANKGDILSLVHIVDHNKCSVSEINYSVSSGSYLVTTLGSLCKACRPEVEIEALVIQGPKMETVMSQVKKLEVSVLVLGQQKTSPFLSCLCIQSSSEKFVEECIENVDCLTIGVTKQSKGVGGYLISTRWHKNFWLLA